MSVTTTLIDVIADIPPIYRFCWLVFPHHVSSDDGIRVADTRIG
ncbi:hypothetical protein FHS27_003191 [Rhodopirellula rubra]|uniref:Uncharacterized protein n=1 Tax=Aporhodopirellula rubra TaxID=980271 RepID=A0A7W5H6V9_9BACT|nr:hypothetical protein [Aporhodopirellula rubra]